MFIEQAKDRDDIAAILLAEKLPVDDLPKLLDNFFVASDNERFMGVIGLEIYGDYGLLRSLAVAPEYRNKGVAGKLIEHLENFAASEGLKALYLLTETAPAYFEGKGFQKITRDEVPNEVKIASEFSHVCPVSAIVMKKLITQNMKNILVLCTGNSCRSQIAEGYLRYFAGDRANIYSAGIETHGVNPKAIQVMSEDHIDISGHTSNHVDEYMSIQFDQVITVCDNANEACPFFPGKVERFHHNFPDPAKATGTPEQVMHEFRRVRDMIKTYAADFIKAHVA